MVNLKYLNVMVLVGLAALLFHSLKTGKSPLEGEETAAAPPAASEASGPQLWQAEVPPTYVLDLESGRVRDSDPALRDLWWQAKTHTERCLCPYYQTKALIAPIAAADFEALDGTKLALLEYSNEGIADSDGQPGVEPGTALAVRTAEGNFAKVRVVKLGGKGELTLQWKLYPAAAQPVQTAAPMNASLEIPRLLEQATTALRARDGSKSLELLQKASRLAGQMTPGSAPRIMLLHQIGSLYWSVTNLGGETRQAATLAAEQAFLAGIAEMHEAPAPGGATGALRRGIAPRTAEEIYRMLGVVYFDRARTVNDASLAAEAVPWFSRAVGIAELEPEGTLRAYMMVSALDQLADAQCQSGDSESALASEARVSLICKQTGGAGSAGVCKPEYRGCNPFLHKPDRPRPSAGAQTPAP